jgi:hypothetical protein
MITSIIPLPNIRSAAPPVYGMTLDEADGSEIGVVEGATGLLYVLGGGGATYSPVAGGAGGAGGAVQDPVP